VIFLSSSSEEIPDLCPPQPAPPGSLVSISCRFPKGSL
jgi:hypothetical protein